MESWPPNLISLLNLCLDANCPLALYWGTNFNLFYNDSWRPIAGNKHPAAFGTSGRVVWAEVWEVIGPMFEGVRKTGQGIWNTDTPLPLERFGFVEECYFNFNLSPIKGPDGSVEGILNVVVETTYRVVHERRTQFLQKLASQIATANKVQEICDLAPAVIRDNSNDIPFSLLYLVDQEHRTAKLVSTTGLSKDIPETIPKTFELAVASDLGDPWKITEVAKTQKALIISDVTLWTKGLTALPYPEIPQKAYALPILSGGRDRLAGIFIAGVSPRRPLDDDYKSFLSLTAGHLSAAINNAHIHEEERRRAEYLSEIDRAKTVFFSNVSHELRTPITLLLGPLEEMLSEKYGPLSMSQKEQVEIMHRNALRLNKLVNTLLDFSRIEAGRVEPIYVATDLALITSDLAKLFLPAISRAGMKLVLDCAPLPHPVYLDSDMWEKIVLNLLSNAFKYTLQGEIRVCLCTNGNSAELSVSDTGTGIPDTELTKIFQRFHRVQGAQGRTHEGTGIGLSLVQELVKLHGGDVTVDSVLGKGTTFTVRIPFGKAHLKDNPTRSPTSNSVPTPSLPATTARAEAFVGEALRSIPEEAATKNSKQVPSNRKRILLADDNADMRAYLNQLLTPHYEVVTVANGKVALEESQRCRPDLVLTDYMMPVMDGLELVKAIRADPELSHLPIIMLSARAGEESKVSGIELGVDDYLTKPFSSKELLARVHTQIKLNNFRQKALAQVTETNKELESFSYSVAHDLRSPLRGILGFISILREEQGSTLNATAIEYLSKVDRAAHKMEELINGLIRLAGVTRQEIRTKSVNLTELVENIAHDLQSQEPNRKVNFKIAQKIEVQGDPILLHTMLTNLIGNSWKFTSTRTNAEIEFGIENQDGKDVYFLRDNGVGFDMKYSDRLFGAFQRLHSSKEFEGTGIGLATVQRIIKRHTGKIWPHSILNQGTTFYFILES